jgi:hypothetical protein
MIAGFPFIASSFDPDARAFVQTSGATDRAALNFFVKGIKRLGLWDDMACWPLRSAQNAGTGSTAYSLGGLGTYNGTLVNGPTWGANGIAFTTSSQEITRAGFDTPPSPMTFGAVSDKSNTAAVMRSRFFGAFPNRFVNADIQNTRSFDIRNQNNVNYLTWSPAVSANFIFKSASITGNLTAEGYANGSLLTPSTNIVAVGWDDAAGDSTSLIATTTGSDATINVSFFFVVQGVAATAAQHAAINALYKSTLGQGLSLP